MLRPGHNCSYVLLWMVCGWILIKILRDTQVCLTILEWRTLPVSTHDGFWTCTTIITLSLRDLKTCAAVEYNSRNSYDVRRYRLLLALHVGWLEVPCSHYQHINWTHRIAGGACESLINKILYIYYMALRATRIFVSRLQESAGVLCRPLSSASGDITPKIFHCHLRANSLVSPKLFI